MTSAGKKIAVALLSFFVAFSFLAATSVDEAFASSKKVGKVTGVKYKRSSSNANRVTLTWKSAKNAKGYKVYRKYSKTWKRIKTTKSRKYTFTVKKTAKYRIRGYRGNRYGSYSSTYTIKYKKPKSSDSNVSKLKYDYEAYLPTTKDGKYYSGYTYPIIVKTDNPSGYNFEIKISGGDSMEGPDLDYTDFEYIEESDLIDIGDGVILYPKLKKIKGGAYEQSFTFEDAGTYTIRVCELDEEDEVRAEKDFTVTFDDTHAAKDQWMDEVIAKYTTSSQNPLEKMESISAGLKNDFKYTYHNVNDPTDYLYLAADCNPWFISESWESSISPHYLAKIANKIGGFDEVQDMYGVYNATTQYDLWAAYHSKVKLTYNGTTEYLSACPSDDTGLIDPDTVTKFDVNDSSMVTALTAK
ncbi:MAG: fibronectin type III domain-containing protein [Anaerovoracaceae bacterium]|jgi:hypothetical protein